MYSYTKTIKLHSVNFSYNNHNIELVYWIFESGIPTPRTVYTFIPTYGPHRSWLTWSYKLSDMERKYNGVQYRQGMRDMTYLPALTNVSVKYIMTMKRPCIGFDNTYVIMQCKCDQQSSFIHPSCMQFLLVHPYQGKYNLKNKHPVSSNPFTSRICKKWI